MTADERPEPGVWQQLRNRRVTRTVVTYLSVGFAALEGTWFLVERNGLVNDVGRLVMGVLVLGFPLAVVLAWTYDLTPDGIVRTPEDMAANESRAQDAGVNRIAWLTLCTCAVGVGLVFRSLRL